MSQRLTNILGYLTLFAILGAIWVMFGEDPARDQGARGERTFAGLEERINEVATLEISKGTRILTIYRDNDVWRMKERGGYEVDPEKVRTMLRGIALSERREPKTSKKTRYERLGLGKKAKTIELRDDTGGVIGSFDMGDRKAASGGRSLTYVFQAKDTRTWLVSELAETVVDAGWWLKRPVFTVDARRFSDVIIGGAWLTRKLGDRDYRLQGKRGFETVATNWKLADPARIVSSLNFEDVRPLNNPLSEAMSLVEFTTYDGLGLKVSLYEFDGEIWAQINAEFDTELQNEGTAGSLPAAPNDGAAEAQEIMNAVRGWVFRLSEADAAVFQYKRADFLTAPAE